MIPGYWVFWGVVASFAGVFTVAIFTNPGPPYTYPELGRRLRALGSRGKGIQLAWASGSFWVQLYPPRARYWLWKQDVRALEEGQRDLDFRRFRPDDAVAPVELALLTLERGGTEGKLSFNGVPSGETYDIGRDIYYTRAQLANAAQYVETHDSKGGEISRPRGSSLPI